MSYDEEEVEDGFKMGAEGEEIDPEDMPDLPMGDDDGDDPEDRFH